MDPTSDALAAPNPRRLGDLAVRATSGLVMIAVAVSTTLFGGAVFAIFWLAASIAVHWEWQTLVGRKNLAMRIGLGALALLVAVWVLSPKLTPFSGSTQIDVVPLGVVLLAGAATQALLVGRRLGPWAAAGSLYSGLFIVSVLALRFSFPDGSRAIIWLFAVVWSTDIFAYFGGRLIGGPKLWPRISPSKTWSGTLTGVAAGALAGTFVSVRDLMEPTSIVCVFALSLSAAILSQAGDAFESAMKRRFGVKDSSRLIPGHGGAMDRLDGFIAATLFAFTIGLLRGLPSVANGLFCWP